MAMMDLEQCEPLYPFMISWSIMAIIIKAKNLNIKAPKNRDATAYSQHLLSSVAAGFSAQGRFLSTAWQHHAQL